MSLNLFSELISIGNVVAILAGSLVFNLLSSSSSQLLSFARKSPAAVDIDYFFVSTLA